MIQCPHCGAFMAEYARFCPGCGTPRTAVREQLQRQAAETGVPYETLVQQAREQDQQAQAGSWSHTSMSSVPQQQQNNRIWWILGIIGGVVLLLCVACIVGLLIVRERTGLSIGETSAGEVAREAILLGARGQYGEQWDLLHPAHQEVVPRDLFIDCSTPREIRDLQILLEFNEDVDVPRIGRVRSRVVTYAMVEDGQSVGDLMRMVTANGSWRWTLAPEDLTIYEAGRCPA